MSSTAHPALLEVNGKPVVFLTHAHQRGQARNTWGNLAMSLGVPGFWVLDGIYLP